MQVQVRFQTLTMMDCRMASEMFSKPARWNMSGVWNSRGLVPLNCCRMARVKAMRRAVLMPGLTRSRKPPSFSFSDRAISSNSAAAYALPPIRVSTARASSFRFTWANHLGLSGTKARPMRRSAMGTISEANIHRQEPIRER